jgi:hypothetical protein
VTGGLLAPIPRLLDLNSSYMLSYYLPKFPESSVALDTDFELRLISGSSLEGVVYLQAIKVLTSE